MISGVVRTRATASETAPPADAADVRARVAELFAAGPRKARTVRDALIAQLRATPSLRAALPDPADAPEPHRRAIVDAHAAALVTARDGEGLCALVASLDGELAWGLVMAAGNARDPAPFAPAAAHALERDEPDVLLAAIYFARRWLAAGGDVAPLAPALVRAAADDRRGDAIKGKVSTAARDALRDAAQRPADRPAIDAAVAAAEPASLRRALEKLLGDSPPPPRTVPDAIRALQRDPRLQVFSLAYAAVARSVWDFDANLLPSTRWRATGPSVGLAHRAA